MLKYDKSNSYPVFQVKTGLFINQMFTKGENRLYMNKQESDIMKILLQTPFINQRMLAEASGHSLGGL